MTGRVNLLPFIVIALGVIALVFMVALRPRSQRSLSTASASSAAVISEDINIVVNGQAVEPGTISQSGSNRVAQRDPRTWQLGQISRIDKRGSRTTLVFRDGSVANVTSSNYPKLAGNIRVRINYEGY